MRGPRAKKKLRQRGSSYRGSIARMPSGGPGTRCDPCSRRSFPTRIYMFTFGPTANVHRAQTSFSLDVATIFGLAGGRWQGNVPVEVP
jgi:hypothetical protein